jgi:hypothetical protein
VLGLGEKLLVFFLPLFGLFHAPVILFIGYHVTSIMCFEISGNGILVSFRVVGIVEGGKDDPLWRLADLKI